jgi:hypothetical protein
MNQVIPGCKNHQHKDESEPDAEADFLRGFAQGPAPDRLDQVKQQMTAIEHRYRE